jgi:hypothetical protein
VWAVSLITDTLDSVDNNAAAVGLGSQIKQITDPIRDQVSRFNYNLMKQYALQVVVQLKDRDSIYTQSASGLQAAMIAKTNRIGRALGPNYPVSITAPLASGLASSQFIRLFLDQVGAAALSIPRSCYG